MLDLDAAAIRHQRNNPPPPWWPVPPPEVGKVWHYHPTTGAAHGAARLEATLTPVTPPPPPPPPPVDPAPLHPSHADADITRGDIMASTHPGDSVARIASRLGQTRGWMERQRARDPQMALEMDRRRGRASSYSWAEAMA